MTNPAMTDADSKAARLRGAYYRARVVAKDRANIEPATRLLDELSRDVGEAHEPVLKLQIRRLAAQARIRAGQRNGREEMLALIAEIGGAAADIDGVTDEYAAFLDDVCGDLTSVGAHDEAVTIAARLTRRRAHRELIAIRLGNLAAWHLQRAVAHRAADNVPSAFADLDAAADLAARALASHASSGWGGTLHEREAQAVALSVAVERSAIEDVNLSASINGLRALLVESLSVPRHDTYLQVGYRIGRLGVAHIRSARTLDARERSFALTRGRSYLQLAWSSSGNATIRPWLALDLHEALIASGNQEGAISFANEALRRLTIQCGAEYPAVRCIAARS